MPSEMLDMLRTDLGPDEPALVRPYVRYLALYRPMEAEAWTVPPGPLSRGGVPSQPPVVERPAPVRTVIRSHARRADRGRRQFLALGTGVLAVALAGTAVAVSADDRPAAMAVLSGATTGVTTVAPAGTGHLTTAIVPAPVPDSRTGAIRGSAGLCLDAGAASVRLRGCNGTGGQSWTLTVDGTVQALGRCLQPAGGTVRLRDCDGGPAQAWRPGPAGALANRASGQCLSTPARVAACDRSARQRWTLP
jgi:hypothetical protein